MKANKSKRDTFVRRGTVVWVKVKIDWRSVWMQGTVIRSMGNKVYAINIHASRTNRDVHENNIRLMVKCHLCGMPTEDYRFWTTKAEPLCNSCYNKLVETYREYQQGINVLGR